MSRVDRRGYRPLVEGVEERVTPVGFFTRAQVVFMQLQRDHALTAQAAPAAPKPALSGTVTGTFQLSSAVLNQNTSATVTGSGFDKRLGSVNVTGAIKSIAQSPPGQLQGSLTLSNGRGSVVLGISARVPTNLSTIPTSIPSARVVIQGGSGAYANLRGAGTATIHLGPFAASGTSGAFRITYNASPPRH